MSARQLRAELASLKAFTAQLEHRVNLLEEASTAIVADATWSKACLNQALRLLGVTCAAGAVTDDDRRTAANFDEIVAAGARQDIAAFLREMENRDPGGAAHIQAQLEQRGILHGSEDEAE